MAEGDGPARVVGQTDWKTILIPTPQEDRATGGVGARKVAVHRPVPNEPPDPVGWTHRQGGLVVRRVVEVDVWRRGKVRVQGDPQEPPVPARHDFRGEVEKEVRTDRSIGLDDAHLTPLVGHVVAAVGGRGHVGRVTQRAIGRDRLKVKSSVAPPHPLRCLRALQEALRERGWDGQKKRDGETEA